MEEREGGSSSSGGEHGVVAEKLCQASGDAGTSGITRVGRRLDRRDAMGHHGSLSRTKPLDKMR
jgi:hypothetical protein